jgi:hypothetical protein
MPTGYIYEIKSTDTSVTEYYIGSTWDMKERLQLHASNCCNETGEKYNYPVYRYIRENGGFHTFNMTMIDSGECEDRTELKCGEQFYIDMAGGIDNLLNCKDALEDKQQRKEKQAIRIKKFTKKNVDTKRFPCNLCGFYFESDCKLQKHLAGPTHKKKLTKVK